MSFGRPPTFNVFSPTPPARGSFPLDHDGDCTAPMRLYLACLKEHKNNNGACRELSKAYLQCRMDNGLMEKDDFTNLGYADLAAKEASAGSSTSALGTSAASSSTASHPPADGRRV